MSDQGLRYLMTLPVQYRPEKVQYFAEINDKDSPQPIARVDTEGRVSMYPSATKQEVVLVLIDEYGVSDEVFEQVPWADEQ